MRLPTVFRIMSSDTQLTLQKHKLRNAIKEKRTALTENKKTTAASALTKYFLQTPYFKNSQTIAFYMAENGELNPHEILEAAWDQGKQCYLPVLANGGGEHLVLVRYEKNDLLHQNRYGILEPMVTAEKTIESEKLDLVLVPLVAFDLKGNRLGMGAGYYDKTFEFKLKNHEKPVLIGLGYEFQKADQIASESWDVPMDSIATEKQIYHVEKKQ